MGGECAPGAVELRVLPSGVIIQRLVGFVTRAMMKQRNRELLALARSAPRGVRLLADALDLEAFEPGAPATGMAARLHERIGLTHLAVVARPSGAAGLVHVCRVLMPRVQVELFASRLDARSFLERAGRTAPGPDVPMPRRAAR
jgi:hypothetical protein